MMFCGHVSAESMLKAGISWIAWLDHTLFKRALFICRKMQLVIQARMMMEMMYAAMAAGLPNALPICMTKGCSDTWYGDR